MNSNQLIRTTHAYKSILRMLKSMDRDWTRQIWGGYPEITSDGVSIEFERGRGFHYRRPTNWHKNVDRVLVSAGYLERERRTVTRTFRVRKDGTFNIDGIRKAVNELTELRELNDKWQGERRVAERRREAARREAETMLGMSGPVRSLTFPGNVTGRLQLGCCGGVTLRLFGDPESIQSVLTKLEAI